MQRDLKLIVPAAGIGSRMGLSYPKALFPVNGQPILWHILQACMGLAVEGVVVTSPSGDAQIAEFLRSWRAYPTHTAIQQKPVGMADAVWTGLNFFPESAECDYLVVWGDQVTVQNKTLQKTLEHHRQRESWLTFPTSYRADPYIHIQRDASGKVSGVLEKREGDEMPAQGENDCGVFIVKGAALRSGLEELKAATYDPQTGKYARLRGTSSGSGEFNFLPLITFWVQAGHVVEALPIAGKDETLGINTPTDAKLAELNHDQDR